MHRFAEFIRLLGRGKTLSRSLTPEEAERAMLADMPIMPVYFYVSMHMVKPWVGGYTANIMDHTYHKDWYVLKH